MSKDLLISSYFLPFSSRIFFILLTSSRTFYNRLFLHSDDIFMPLGISDDGKRQFDERIFRFGKPSKIVEKTIEKPSKILLQNSSSFSHKTKKIERKIPQKKRKGKIPKWEKIAGFELGFWKVVKKNVLHCRYFCAIRQKMHKRGITRVQISGIVLRVETLLLHSI